MKITGSQAKLAEYARLRALDAKALPLIDAGMGIAEAYKIALDEEESRGLRSQ